MSKAPVNNDFLKLICDNQRVIFKICHVYCTHSEDREDLAQEIIYQLWRSGSSFKEEYKFSTWMYRVALNVAISFYRKRLTMPVVAFQENHLDIGELQAKFEELRDSPVQRAVNREAVWVHPDTPIAEALRLFCRNHTTIPVVERDSRILLGMISYWDAAKLILKDGL